MSGAAHWLAEETEHDIAGASVASGGGARLVRELVDLDNFYDLTLRRIIENAIALPACLEVDLSKFDDGLGIIGPHVIVMGQAITDNALARIVIVSKAAEIPVIELAGWVVGLPCDPCPKCVGHMAQEVQRAADRRAAMVALEDAKTALLGGVPVAEAMLAVAGLTR